jgi:hypothetical protein
MVTTTLPPDLPVPEDDGGAAHLSGARMPSLALPSTDGSFFPVDQPPTGFDRLVLYAYPRTPPGGPFPHPRLGCHPRSVRLHS